MEATRSFRARAIAPGRNASGRRGAGTVRFAVIVMVMGFPLISLMAATTYFDSLETILPGIQVGAYELQGLTPEQAAMELDRIWNQDLRITAVDMEEPQNAWLISPGEFGLQVDAAETAARAFAIGRGQGGWKVAEAFILGLSGSQQLRPVVRLDVMKALASYEAWAHLVYRPAKDAALYLEGGNVVIEPGEAGRELDVLASVEMLVANPGAALVDYAIVPLITRSVEPQIAEVERQASQIQALLDTPITISAYDPIVDQWFRWSPNRERIGSWIGIPSQGEQVGITLDEEAMRSYLEELVGELGPERMLDLGEAVAALKLSLDGEVPEALILSYQPREYIVQPGDTMVSISFKVGIPYWKWLELNPEVQRRGLSVGETLTIPPKDALLELPVVANKRIVVSIPEQHMWVYEDGRLIADHVVSTGIPNSPTMPGVFQVKSHYLNAYASNWDLYMPHFLGIYHATPNLLNGIHGLPLLSSGRRLWANVLGQPASYGCIILDLQAAEDLYDWAEDGVVVEIQA